MPPAVGKIEQLSIAHNELDVFKIGEVFAQSGLFSNARDMSKAVVQIMAGAEMGFGAFASMSNIHIVQGKCVVGATLIAAAIKKSGKYTYRILQHTSEICELEIFERGTGYDFKSIGKSSFSIEEARAAQLANKDNWKKHPADMLFARAISRAAKHHCADVFGTAVYTPGEIEESTEQSQSEPKTIRSAQGEISPLMTAPKKQVIEAEILAPDALEGERAIKEKEIFALCKRLSIAGDLTLESKRLLNNYINEKWETDGGIDALDFNYLDALKDELTERVAAAEDQPQPAF